MGFDIFRESQLYVGLWLTNLGNSSNTSAIGIVKLTYISTDEWGNTINVIDGDYTFYVQLDDTSQGIIKTDPITIQGTTAPTESPTLSGPSNIVTILDQSGNPTGDKRCDIHVNAPLGFGGIYSYDVEWSTTGVVSYTHLTLPTTPYV